MEARKISLSDFQSKLGSLRYGDYYRLATEIQDDLNLPENTTHEKMESLLIKATKDCFDDTIEGDIVLMALGLMKGFYHHEAHGKAKKEVPIKRRRIKFLNESTYLNDKYGNLYTSYEDVEKSGSKTMKQVFDKLTKTEDRCIDKVAAIIYNKSDERLKKYMPVDKIELPECKSTSSNEGKKTYANNIETKDCISGAVSPNVTADELQFEENTYCMEDITASSDGGTYTRKHDNVTIRLNINNMGFDTGYKSTGRNLPPIEHIFVPAEAFSLKPWETYVMETAVLPKEAQGAFLSYVSSDTNIVTVSSDGIVAAKEKCGTADIIIQAESGCTVKVPVTVSQKDTSGSRCYGWGPKRPTYTNERPAAYAVFNSITNNSAVGDERDFVRIEEKNSGRPYSSEIILEAGKQYEVYIYYHNDASEAYNTKEHNYVAIARDARLSSSFPDRLKTGQRAAVTARITASNTVPESVWDAAHITAKQDMSLHYVTASAKIYNQWDVNGSVLSTDLFSQRGTFIGLDKLNGAIPGGSKYSGQIVYTIQTRAISED